MEDAEQGDPAAPPPPDDSCPMDADAEDAEYSSSFSDTGSEREDAGKLGGGPAARARVQLPAPSQLPQGAGAPRDPGSPVPDDNFELAVASRGRRRGAASGSSRRTRARR